MKRRKFNSNTRGISSVIAAMLVMTTFVMSAAAEKKEANVAGGSGGFTLGKVEVTGKSDAKKSPAVTTVSGEEIRQFDRNTVAEAANLVPGVTLSKVGGRNESMVFVRGFDVKHAPIFLDGIPIYTPYDGYPDLGRFLTYDLSELDISKGFASVLYGPNTMGGAINMISKRPAKTFEGNLGAGYASGDTYHALANLGTNQKTWYVQAGGSLVDSSYFDLSKDYKPAAVRGVIPEDGDKRENSYQRDSKGTIKIGLTPNSTDEYALSYIYQHGEKGVPPYSGANSSEKLKYWQWPRWDKKSVYFNSNTAIGTKNYVKSRLYYDQFKNALNIYTGSDYSTINSGNRSWYDDYTMGGSIEAGTSLIPGNALKVAFHFKDDVHREQSDASPQQRFEDRVYSFAAEDTIELTKKLSATIGASYDIQASVEAQDYNKPTATAPAKVLYNLPTAQAEAINPQISLFYAFSNTGKAHASIAMKSRFPSMKDKYSYKFGTYIPNPDLKAEKSVNYEIGAEEVVAGLVRVKASAFFIAVTDYIQAVTLSSTTSQNQNFGKVNRYGYELEAMAPIGDKIETGFNYTYIYNDNQSNSLKITDIPEHKLFFYGKVTPVKPLSVLASAEYDTKRFSTTDGIYATGDFMLVNIKASYEALKNLTLEVGANNVLDKNYALTEGYPEPGRNYFCQARYSF